MHHAQRLAASPGLGLSCILSLHLTFCPRVRAGVIYGCSSVSRETQNRRCDSALVYFLAF